MSRPIPLQNDHRYPRLLRLALSIDVRAGDRFAFATVAGIATGLAHALLIDRLIGGPGLLAAFGL